MGISSTAGAVSLGNRFQHFGGFDTKIPHKYLQKLNFNSGSQVTTASAFMNVDITGWNVGDAVVIHMNQSGGFAPRTTPAGWTYIAQSVAYAQAYQSVLYRVMQAGDTNNITIQNSASGGTLSAISYVVRKPWGAIGAQFAINRPGNAGDSNAVAPNSYSYSLGSTTNPDQALMHLLVVAGLYGYSTSTLTGSQSAINNFRLVSSSNPGGYLMVAHSTSHVMNDGDVAYAANSTGTGAGPLGIMGVNFTYGDIRNYQPSTGSPQELGTAPFALNAIQFTPLTTGGNFSITMRYLVELFVGPAGSETLIYNSAYDHWATGYTGTSIAAPHTAYARINPGDRISWRVVPLFAGNSFVNNITSIQGVLLG